MIAFLRGRVLETEPNRVIVDVGGVGYAVHIPLSTFSRMPEPGGEVSFRIHTHVREDALLLFGFATAFELDVFERLIGISGIGPKLALAVLSGIDVPDLVQAVRTGDVARLTAIPGIGKKTAERIGLELKDRLPLSLAAAGPQDDVLPRRGDLEADLLSALLNLGYHRSPAERAIEAALKAAPDRSFERVLRQALHELAR